MKLVTTMIVNSFVLHLTRFKKKIIAFFRTQFCKWSTVGRMARVTDTAKLIKNTMQLEAHQISSF